jgi:D-tyrosyl-tRNA(Tyr) deacylase
VLAVVQRVSSASVRVGDDYEASIDRGLLILLGVAQGDTDEDARWLAEKCSTLRIFNDDDGKMNLGLDTVGGSALVISQFTLLGDCAKGRRPSFIRAADPREGDRLYELFASVLASLGVPVRKGIFGAMMEVSLVNDGPVTLIIDSAPWRERRHGSSESAQGGK